MKLIGAMFVICACGWFGFSLVLNHKQEEASLGALISALDYMQCELQFHLTPLPELCSQIGRQQTDNVGKLFARISGILELQQIPDVGSCVRQGLLESPNLPERTVRAMETLGATLGRFDLPGQIAGIESVRTQCRQELESLRKNRDERLRSYQTLGLCAGAALAILFI